MEDVNMKKYQPQLIRVWKDSGREIIQRNVYDVEGTKKMIDELNRKLPKDNSIECYELMFSSGPN